MQSEVRFYTARKAIMEIHEIDIVPLFWSIVTFDNVMLDSKEGAGEAIAILKV